MPAVDRPLVSELQSLSLERKGGEVFNLSSSFFNLAFYALVKGKNNITLQSH